MAQTPRHSPDNGCHVMDSMGPQMFIMRAALKFSLNLLDDELEHTTASDRSCLSLANKTTIGFFLSLICTCL